MLQYGHCRGTQDTAKMEENRFEMKRLGLYYSSPQILSKMLGIQLYVSGVVHTAVSSDDELFIPLLNHNISIVFHYYVEIL